MLIRTLACITINLFAAFSVMAESPLVEQETFNLYESKAKQGDADASYELALIYLDVNGGYYAPDIAERYLLSLMRQGELRAYVRLAELLIDKDYEGYNLSRSEMMVNAYMTKGGQGAYGLMSYIFLLKEHDNHQQILALATRGYEQKQAYSLLAFAHMHQYGIAVPKDLTIAIDYYEKVSKMGIKHFVDVKSLKIERYSPKLSGKVLFGMNSVEFEKAVLAMNANKLTSDNESIQIWQFKDHPLGILSLTIALTKSSDVSAAKYVFDSKSRALTNMSTSLSGRFGTPTVLDSMTRWENELIDVSLTHLTRCLGDCDDGKTIQIAQLDYKFLPLIEAKPEIATSSIDHLALEF